MNRIIFAVCAMMLCFSVAAQEQQQTQQVIQQENTDVYEIIKDEVVDGVRCVSAVPGGKVCSKQIDIKVKDGTVSSKR